MKTNMIKHVLLAISLVLPLAAQQQQVPVSTNSSITLPTSGAGTTQPALITPTDWQLFNAKQPALGFTPENLAKKNAVGGYAGLDAAGKFPWIQVSGIPVASATTDGVLTHLDWTTLSAKQNALGFTPENAANRNRANGYAGLDLNGLLPWTQISNVPVASATTSGCLRAQDFAAFSAKQPALGFTPENTATKNLPNGYAGLDASGAILGTQLLWSHISNIPSASATTRGVLLSTDWAVFNAKQNALGFTPENTANENKPNGYAGLDASAKFPWAQISGVPPMQPVLGFTPENAANKGNANGYAALDATGHVPANQLPSVIPTPVQVFNESYSITAGQSVPLTFSLANGKVIPASVIAYLNGLRLSPTIDFTVTGNIVTLTSQTAPTANETVLFDYQHN